jgi:hypothetical protein
MDKKAQEEMVGFVLIVVLVAVVAVVFLGITIRNSGSGAGDPSEKIGSLIGSLQQITTQCEIPETRLQDVGDLIRECVNGRICSNCNGETCGETGSACEVLENTLENALESSYVVSRGSFVKYYNLSIYREEDSKSYIKPIISGDTEKCPGSKLFNGKVANYSEEGVMFSLEVCFND